MKNLVEDLRCCGRNSNYTSLGGLSLIPGQVVCDLCWIMRHWDRFSASTPVSPASSHSTNSSHIYSYSYRYSDCLLAGRPRGRSSSPSRVKNILISTTSRSALGPTQLLIQLVSGALSPCVKRPGREDDHSPPASAEVKKIWIYISTPSYAFMA
jgi:hypothetical protein